MILVIQSNIAGRLDIWGVHPAKKMIHLSRRVRWHGSERLLPLVQQALKDQRVSPNQIDHIVVAVGPGPFTAVRTGIIVANTLGWMLNIPVKGVVAPERWDQEDIARLSQAQTLKTFRPVRPAYGREPNITRSKR